MSAPSRPATPPLHIQIVSDPVCPWCYIGKRRLDRALALRPDIPVEIGWLPFQLSPDMPREGRDRLEHYEQIFGPERAQSIIAQMVDIGQEEGLDFAWRLGARSPNTLRAHVLMHWAGQTAGVDPSLLADRLFAAHHTACEDIGKPAVLARLAGEVGMDPEQVLARLQAGKDEERVRTLIRQVAQSGVNGVPFFILNRQYAFSGAQPAEAILGALDRLAAAAAGS